MFVQPRERQHDCMTKVAHHLVLATVGGADTHAALLVHGVETAVGVLVVVTGVPDVQGVPAGHGVLHRIIAGQNNSRVACTLVTHTCRSIVA